MTRVPDLWWSPSQGLFLRRPGAQSYTPVLDDREQALINRRNVPELPADAVSLRQDMGSDYIRVGETVSTEDRSDTYRLSLGPQAMYLEPVDTDQPHVIDIAEQAWTMKHPVTCRAKLFHCSVHKAALNSEPLGDRIGRFACTVGYDGFLVLGEATT
jgi:hypothetical protein